MLKLRSLVLGGALALPFVPSLASADRGADYIHQTVRLDQKFTRDVGDCHYTVKVNGTITPMDAKAENGSPQVDPRLVVSAKATCPNVESSVYTSHLLDPGPLTWRQLDDTLQQRSRVITVEAGHECTFAAQFQADDKRLDMVRFDRNCHKI